MTFRINSKELSQAKKRVNATVRAIEIAQYRTVNRVASKNRTAASKHIRQQVRLPASYVNENLTVTQKATRQNPLAVISGRKRPTRLARYGAKQLTRAARSAGGDTLRKIPSGRKQAGVSVHVRRNGSRRKHPKAFLLPLNTNGHLGMFIRFGPGKRDIKHMYGPSVDQVFRDVREEIRPKIRRDLAAEYRRQLNYALSKGL
ncbi:MAG: phage tail protein [Pseudomonadota bacterium]|nr:phage tail protein [Pseudomonadota bacterium]